MNTLKIARKTLGEGYPTFVIAEAGVNHNGSRELACQLIDVAVAAGADAVKFQTFCAEDLVAKCAPQAEYQKRALGSDESQLAMIRRLELSYEDFKIIKSYCDQQNIIFLSTPFDQQSVDFLDTLEVPAYKIPSGEVTNWPLLEAIARKNRPMLLSTGMSCLGEVETALQVIFRTENRQIFLLHCVSNYPTLPIDANLRAMQTLRTAFQIPVGYSDHTLGIEVSLAAVALGACVIEKHFTLDRTLPGPDHHASLEPKELQALVNGIQVVEAALGHGRKEPSVSENEIAKVARRSLVSRMTIDRGTVITSDLLTLKRPGTGLPCSVGPYLVGKVAQVDIPADSVLSLEMFR